MRITDAPMERPGMAKSILPHSTVIDEDIPRSKGGNPLDPNNTNALHKHCNQWKSTMTLTEARQLLAAGHPLTHMPTKQSRQNLLAQPVGAWEEGAANY